MITKFFRKNLLMIAAGMIGVGIIFWGLGHILGGSPFFSIGFSGISTPKDYKQEKVAFEPVNNMDLEVSFGDIIFVESDKFYIEYIFTASKSEPEYYIENDTLFFKSDPKSSISFFNFDFPTAKNKNYLKIYMPSNTKLNQMTLNSDSGNVSLSNAEVKDLKANLSFGNVTLKGIVNEDMNLNMSSGKANLTDIETASLYIKNDFGNVTLEQINESSGLGKTGILDLQMSSGNLDMKDVYAQSLNMKSDFGKYLGNNVNINDISAKLSSGECNIKKLNSQKLSIDNDFGDVTLQLAKTVNDYDFDLSTDFGSVSINGNKQGGSVNIQKGADNMIKVKNSSGSIKIETQN